ncbi:hypothetical protein [Niallia taxi]|uniref:hypothetical protein n=1 Tax=Niallia taxi TaxID=2499688 RepID=UPI0015F67335|nr:hypothetical protein [Niallia taxi]MED4057705.1 hypothetical protein [Niallia taxi]
MSIGEQLKRNLENEEKFSMKYEKFKSSLKSFEQNQRNQEYMRNQRILEGFISKK